MNPKYSVIKGQHCSNNKLHEACDCADSDQSVIPPLF